MNKQHGGSFALIVGLLALALFLAVGLWLSFRPRERFVEGQMEATEFNVSAKIPGRVDTVHVRVGDYVERGQLLVTLDSPEIAARLAQARAAQEAADALRRKAQAGARQQEIENARQQLLRAEEAARLAQTTAERIQRLHEQGVLPQQRLDEVQTQAQAARSTADGARALFEMISEGTRTEDREAALAAERQAAAVVEEVRALQRETQLVAPVAGEVRSILVERGELAPAGFPLLTIVDVNDLWAVAHVREDLLQYLKMGDRFPARVPALGGQEVTLAVSYIAPLGDFATWRATRQSSGFDLRTFEVRARPVEPVPGLRPGMSIIVPPRRLAE